MELDTARKVVAALGGLKATAQLVGVDIRSASRWQVAGKFPARTYKRLANELAARGLEAPDALWFGKASAS